jgi:hypothetical protein
MPLPDIVMYNKYSSSEPEIPPLNSVNGKEWF